MATEKELRQQIADWGNAYKGIKEGSTAHKELVNIFNNSGLCTRYKMTTSDAWCAMFVSDAFIACGLTSIFPCVECGCANMVTLAQNNGIWVESDSYTPSIGDVIMYDWDDSGSGDNTGVPDHVGIVQKISGSTMTVIEGNKSDTVGTRSVTVNGKYIRGFITPKYASVASTTSTTTGGKSDATVDPKTVWDSLMAWIGNAYGVAGFMGNIKAESNFIPINLQDSYENKLGYTDQTYTDAVDNGKYSKFSSDSAGYGLCQWTYNTRKKALKAYCDGIGASIGNADAQLGYLKQEVESDFSSMLKTLKNATSVKEASDAVLTKFEQPADQSSSVKTKRAGYGQEYYDQYAGTSSSTSGTKTIEELAQEVIAGKWGNNPERAEALTAAGYDAEAVQALVDKIYGVGGSSGTDPSGIAYAEKLESGYSGGKTYKVYTSSGLNLRKGPSKSYSVIKALPNGTKMTYYGYYTKTNGTKWMLVITGGTTGWVCSTYVKQA